MPRPSDSPASAVGWPEDVPPLGHPEFDRQLTRWLLGLVPVPLAAQAVARRHVDVLLHVAAGVLEGTLEGLRAAYGTARAEIGAAHPPETVAAALLAISETGQQVAQSLAFVELVRAHRGD